MLVCPPTPAPTAAPPTPADTPPVFSPSGMTAEMAETPPTHSPTTLPTTAAPTTAPSTGFYEVQSAVAIRGYTVTTFDASAQQSFIRTVAHDMGLSAPFVSITSIGLQARRRLIGATASLEVKFHVFHIPKDKATSVQEKLKVIKADTTTFVVELTSQIETDGGSVPPNLSVTVTETPAVQYDIHADTTSCMFGDCSKLTTQCEFQRREKCYPSTGECHRDACTCCNFRSAELAAGTCSASTKCVQCCTAPHVCTAETKACPSGTVVKRDPRNGCNFFDCPADCVKSPMSHIHVGHCIKKTHESLPGWDAITVSAVPETVCIQKDTDTGKCVRYSGNPTLHKNPQLAGHPKYGRNAADGSSYHCNCPGGESPAHGWRASCPPDAFKCPSGNVVHRDSNNYCRFTPC